MGILSNLTSDVQIQSHDGVSLDELWHHLPQNSDGYDGNVAIVQVTDLGFAATGPGHQIQEYSAEPLRIWKIIRKLFSDIC